MKFIVVSYYSDGSGRPEIYFCKTAEEMAKVLIDNRYKENSVYQLYESGAVIIIAGNDIRGEM